MLPGLCNVANADIQNATCPVDHVHMGHGLKGTEIQHEGSGFDNGKILAEKVCAECHGKNGISKSEQIPNLAGQEANYLCKSLAAYRLKIRDPAAPMLNEDGLYVPSMHEVATKLDDQQIVDLSIFYTHMHVH